MPARMKKKAKKKVKKRTVQLGKGARALMPQVEEAEFGPKPKKKKKR